MGGVVRSVTRTVSKVIKPVTKIIGGVAMPLISGTTAAIGEGLSELGLTGKSDKSKIISAIPNVAEPAYPGFEDIRDEQGLLPEQYRLQPSTEAIEALRDYATTPTEQNPWLQMRLQEIGGEAAEQQGQIASRAASAVDQARNLMAMRGGIRAGQTGDIQREAEIQKQFARQGIAQRRGLKEAGARTLAEEMREDVLQALPQIEQQALEPQRFNIATSLQERQRAEESAARQFEEQMRAWAARKTGVAYQQSGGGKK